ncbi:hypothetical protein V1517DRAFT_317952 [Lipomyces orientalis]|uniref:Uncharacterized protein n=1 Tax=Lipomyces orientalis TaxID=1233043 RepID=A0ACC3TTG8_9ASCO
MADTTFLDAIANTHIRGAVASYISAHPDAAPVFASLISHLCPPPPASSKKRKHSPQPVVSTAAAAAAAATAPLVFAPGISFSVPQRKKLALALYADRVVLLPANTTANATADSDIISTVPTRDLTGYMYLPTPARATKSYTMLLLPRDPSPNKADAIVFTVPESAGAFTGPYAAAGTGDDDKDESSAGAVLVRVLSDLGGVPRLDDEQTFAVEAHRGTKDGYLYFSTGGVLFGFKKPVWYVARDDIDSVSYSSITRVTFNLTIAVAGMNDEVEFGMIDQAKFAEIDEYVRKWGLADRSMAEERRAKNELKHRHAQDGQDVDGGQLVKAEQEWREIDGNVDSGPEGLAPDDDDDDDDDEDDENFEVDEDDDDGGSPSESSSDETGGGGQDYDEPD